MSTENVRTHKMSVRVGNKTVEGWSDYFVDFSMFEADGFRLTFPGAKRDVWRACTLDAECEIFLDDTRIMSGFIEDRDGDSSKNGGGSITIGGRDRMGRIIDEAAPLVSFNGLGVVDITHEMVKDWFPKVSSSNAINRRLVAGGGARMGKIAKEPAIDNGKRPTRKVNPGDTRWEVLKHFYREAGCLGWSAADGETFIVGQPNYDQAPTFRFLDVAAGSPLASKANVEGFGVGESCGDLYSTITVVGFGQSSLIKLNTSNGRNIRYRGQAKEGPLADGLGGTFSHRKAMIIVDADITSPAHAEKRALQEMATRAAHKQKINVTVAGHAQKIAGARRPTIYCCDTMSHVTSENFDVEGLYLVVGVSFRHSKKGGEHTVLTMLPKGTRLSV